MLFDRIRYKLLKNIRKSSKSAPNPEKIVKNHGFNSRCFAPLSHFDLVERDVCKMLRLMLSHDSDHFWRILGCFLEHLITFIAPLCSSIRPESFKGVT